MLRGNLRIAAKFRKQIVRNVYKLFNNKKKKMTPLLEQEGISHQNVLNYVSVRFK